MAFITHCWSDRRRAEGRAQALVRMACRLCLALGLMLGAGLTRADAAVEMQNLHVQRIDGQIVLSVQWQFELPAALEDALQKGVALYFVTEADITRERWYFYDKRIVRVERHLRLAYLPLTQRWRLNIASQPFSAGGTGVSLAQTFDTLGDALAAVRRLSQWPLVAASEIDPDARHNLDLRFRLDLSQLPRPLQIGLSTQADWSLSAGRVQRLQVDNR